MVARWLSFAVGMWLVLAPLVLGYRAPGAILHDIALGLLVCVATLAALERPALRFAVAIPGLWLLWAGEAVQWGSRAVSATEIGAGAMLLLLSLVPSGKLVAARDSRIPA